MEFLNGIYKKEVTEWDELLGTSLLNQEVILEGAVHSIRNMGDVAFVILRRREGLFQTVVENEKANLSVHDLKEAMTLRVKGILNEEERAPHGREIRIREVEILSAPAEPMPLAIDKWKLNTSLEAKLNLRPIALRNVQERSKFKIQEALTRAFRDFLYEQGFTEIHTPKIGAKGAEGGANLFKLDYFGTPAYLAQSPQFHKQYLAGAFGRVYEIGSVYRAERHNTSRHLNEYMGLDFEMAYIDSMYDVMAMETGMLKSVMAYVKEHCAEELAMLNAEVPEIKEIPTIRFHEAKQIMEEKFGHKSKNRYDLNPDEEVLLCQWAKEEHDSDFVFVTHFPSAKRPFYAKDDPEDPKLALSFDLLFRGLEITTGGQRIHDYQEQMDKLAARKMNAELFESFTMLHKYGMPPHGGLGIGLERLTMQLLGLNNIREASMFPRDMNRLEP